MKLRSILSAIARVELGLAALLVVMIAIGFGIRESDDLWALALTSVLLAAAPAAVLLMKRSNANLVAFLATFLVVSWLPTAWWLLFYA